MEKTDAQQRNEDEVRRIMRERGFETASESKPKKKRRDFDFGIIGKVLAAIVIVGGLSFGAFALINAPKNDEMIKDTSNNEDASQNADYVGLAACLDATYTDVEAGDPQFYPKLIASYKAQLDCHSQYPTPDNESEISDIKQRLSSVEIAAKDAGVSQTDIDSAYESISSEIISNTPRDKNRATNTATQNISSNNSADNTNKNEITSEQKPAQTTTNTKCDNYKLTYGDKTPETLANEDSYVASLYNTWQNWKRQADDWESQGVVLTQSQCSAYTIKGKVCPRNYRLKAQEAEQTYTNAFNSKVQYYTNLRISACGY